MQTPTQTERQALDAAIDRANAPAHANHTPVINGRCAAICQCCNKRSRPVQADHDGEPDLWRMASGWSCAPFPAGSVHRDGSVGSKFTCPACNVRLNRGETLQLRTPASPPTPRMLSWQPDGGYIILDSRLARYMRPRSIMAKQPGTWNGTEIRAEADGRSSTHTLPEHVVDDFGNLVEVPQ